MTSTGPKGGLDRTALRDLQLQKLRALLKEILPRNRFYARKLAAAGIEAREVPSLRTIDDLRRLPFTTKLELEAAQREEPPYGTNLTYPPERYLRLHQTSGTLGEPIRWLDTSESWAGILRCWETIYRAAGVGAADRVFAPFSFGPFLGFWAGFEGAIRLGIRALAGGGMSSAARARFLRDNGATVLLATPTYALRLAEAAREEGIDLAAGPIRSVITAGEPGGSIPAVREGIEAAYGARCLDHWGMTEVGPLGYEEREDRGRMRLIETECIAEVIDPATLAPVAPGERVERGELVITTLYRAGSPVIRYRTGDLVEPVREIGGEAGGEAPLRLEGGILARLDDMVCVRGNNVYPGMVEAALRPVAGIAEYQVAIRRRAGTVQGLCLRIEPAAGADPAALAERAARAFQGSLPFRPEVELAPPGSLPRFEMKARRFIFTEEESRT